MTKAMRIIPKDGTDPVLDDPPHIAGYLVSNAANFHNVLAAMPKETRLGSAYVDFEGNVHDELVVIRRMAKRAEMRNQWHVDVEYTTNRSSE